MALPANDTFTEADDIGLAEHTSDSGHSWSGADLANLAIEAATDELFVDGNTSAALAASPVNPDYYVEVVGKTGATATTDRLGCWARFVEGSAGYLARVYGDGTWSFETLVGALLGSGSIGGFSASTYYTLRITVSGTNVRFSINGAELVNTTNAAYAGAGNPGVYLRGEGRATSIAASHEVGGSQPTVGAVGDGSFRVGETGVSITGANFGATQGIGFVRVCPSDDIEDVNGVNQTVTAWGDTSITFDVVRGSLPLNTNLYLFVENDGGLSNAVGYAVQMLVPVAVLAHVLRI